MAGLFNINTRTQRAISVFLFPILFLCSCSQQITGRLEDCKGQDLCLQFLTNNFSKSENIDTLHVDNNGCFSFSKYQPSEFIKAVISNFEADGKPSRNPNITICLLPQERLHITGTLSKPVIKGSRFYKLQNEFEEITRPVDDSMKALADSIFSLISLYPDSRDSLFEILISKMDPYQQVLRDKTVEFITKYPDEEFSGYLLGNQSNPETFKTCEAICSEKVLDGIMFEYINNARQKVNAQSARKATETCVDEGEKAPDFTLFTPEGGKFKLSSLEGKKMVMLDFWGSWCSWCIKAIPDLKLLYEKYSDRIEFVSIACNDSEKNWKKALEKNKMPWTQVKNNDSEYPVVDAMYGVSGYPTFVFIDIEGRVLRKFVGESEDFKEYFIQLFQGK